MEEEEKITDIDDAVQRALIEAKKAAKENSYGVGGLLVNAQNGQIIHKMHNEVISNDDCGKSRLKDPTAHGERQLVDWYFENKQVNRLPEPKDIIVITTLDPCCMCTGSILSAGFKVAVAASDEQAGIARDNVYDFKPFEGQVLQQIKNTFIYPEEIGIQPRTGFGDLPRIFTGNKLKSEIISDCKQTFNKGAELARGIIGKIWEVSELLDIKSLPDHHQFVDMLKKNCPYALTYRAQDRQNPDEGLADCLIEAALIDKKNGGDGDAVAFLDYFGNLLICKPGNKNASPIRTAYMETIRTYQHVRYLLTKEKEKEKKDDDDNEALRYLSEPKYGTFIFVKGFDKGTQSFADLGAYGSTILGELKNPFNLQYITPRIPQSELTGYITNMPPRYKKLITPQQVTNKNLIDKVEKGIKAGISF